MLNLIQFRFQNIGRFTEEQVLDLDKLGNLVQVDGENHNTGGSSGAGKSTIFNAFDFLLGLNSFPTTVLQSRLTEESLFVQGKFDLDGKQVTISRGKKLKIEVDGDVTTGSSKISEEKLDQLLSIPRNLVRPMIHKKQGEKGFFLNFTPKETNSFLTDCLGLEIFSKHLLNLDLALAKLLSKKNAVDLYSEMSRTGLEASQNALLSLGTAPLKEVTQETILVLKARSERSRAEFQAIIDRHEQERAELEASRPRLIQTPFDFTSKNKYERTIAAVAERAQKLHLDEKDRQSNVHKTIGNIKIEQNVLENGSLRGKNAKEEAVKLALDIKKIRENLCPYCERTWLSEKTKSKETDLLELLKNCKEKIATGEESDAKFIGKQRELDALIQSLSPVVSEEAILLNEQLVELQKLIDQEKTKEIEHHHKERLTNTDLDTKFRDKIASLTERYSKEVEGSQGQMELDRRTLDIAVVNFKGYEEARVRYEKQTNTLKTQEKVYQNQIEKFALDSTVISNSMDVMEELKRAVKSFLSCSFDEALDTISENATKLVRHVPNMANATIQLSGVRETKDGKIKEEVNAVLNLDGDENVDIRSLCGGERSSCDLAIDLSVIDYIEQKTGKGMNILILDEPFTGLDTVCVEMALEVLKNSNPHKKIIVVDHNPVVKESISDRIVVVRNGLISNVVQN
jgi:ABC-type branched-subunit amino acid transport system ATPase component